MIHVGHPALFGLHAVHAVENNRLIIHFALNFELEDVDEEGYPRGSKGKIKLTS